MNARQRQCQIGFEVCIRPLDRRRARNDHVIELGARQGKKLPSGCLEPPTHSIAHNGPTHLLAHSEPEPRAICLPTAPSRRFPSRLRLDHQRRRAPPQATPDSQELGALFQCGQFHAATPLPPDAENAAAARRPRRQSASRRETLAPLGPATGKHPGSSDCLHTLAEAVAALAHETARLVGAFHVLSPYRSQSRGWPSGEGPNGSPRARHPSGYGPTCPRDL